MPWTSPPPPSSPRTTQSWPSILYFYHMYSLWDFIYNHDSETPAILRSRIRTWVFNISGRSPKCDSLLDLSSGNSQAALKLNMPILNSSVPLPHVCFSPLPFLLSTCWLLGPHTWSSARDTPASRSPPFVHRKPCLICIQWATKGSWFYLWDLSPRLSSFSLLLAYPSLPLTWIVSYTLLTDLILFSIFTPLQSTFFYSVSQILVIKPRLLFWNAGFLGFGAVS